MALQTFKGTTTFPERLTYTSGTIAYTSLAIDASLEKAAFIIEAPKTGVISKVAIRTTTVTTGATLDVTLESVSAITGDPSGTLLGASTSATQIVADTDDNVEFLVTLTSGASVTRGDLFAVVIANPLVSFGNLSLAAMAAGINGAVPYSDLFGVGWIKSAAAPVIALEYSDGSYEVVEGAFPFSSVTSTSFNSTSTPDERGLRFKPPFRCRVGGFWFIGNTSNDATFRLFDSDGSTVLLTKAVDGQQRLSNTNHKSLYLFSGTADLLPNTFYRLALRPDTGSDVSIQEFTTSTAAKMDAMCGGQNCHLTTRTDAGSWTDTTTQRPLMGVLLDALDDNVFTRFYPGTGGGLCG